MNIGVYIGIMIDELDIHNQFKESLTRYKKHDPHLKKLADLPLVYHSPLLEETVFHSPGIYLITGGRQIGKTTFLKQLILNLLKKNTSPKDILFLTGEIIDTHQILRRIIGQFHAASSAHQYLIIDEVNYIPDWDKSIKFLADSGFLDRITVILTGSDSQIIRTSMKRFAGRRGKAAKIDFIFSPLNFKEFICLKNKNLKPVCEKVISTPLTRELQDYNDNHNTLTGLFYEYLFHGGYLPAINEYALKKTISTGTMNTYIHWIIGDVLKYNKSEHYLFETLRGIKATYNTPISWNNLSRFLPIEHHKTISDYCEILASIHVLHIQQAIMEHKLIGAPKKNRKLYFRDPFIDHSITQYLNPEFSINQIQPQLKNNEFASKYVEAITVDHCKRRFPTYYIKGKKGEVDIALVLNQRMYPIEIKWTDRLRNEELKQIQKYENGIILTPKAQLRRIDNNISLPLVRFLIHISSKQFVIF